MSLNQRPDNWISKAAFCLTMVHFYPQNTIWKVFFVCLFFLSTLTWRQAACKVVLMSTSYSILTNSNWLLVGGSLPVCSSESLLLLPKEAPCLVHCPELGWGEWLWKKKHICTSDHSEECEQHVSDFAGTVGWHCFLGVRRVFAAF